MENEERGNNFGSKKSKYNLNERGEVHNTMKENKVNGENILFYIPYWLLYYNIQLSQHFIFNNGQDY